MARILIIKTGALGDVVIATSAMKRILDAHAGDEVWLLTSAPFAELFASWDRLNVHVAPRKGWRAMLALLGWIRRQRFGRIYDLQSNDRSAILCALSGAAMRVGNHPRFPYSHHPSTPHRKDEHGFLRLQMMLAAAGLPAAAEKPHLPASMEERVRVGAWLETHALADRSFVLLHAGASPGWPSKRWPYYAGLAQRLALEGLQAVWLGSTVDADINANLARCTGIDATGEFSIPALAALAEHARFAVTNDSGPMHVLAAAGIPVFAFFGPTDWRRSHALGQRQRALFNPLPCVACRRTDRAGAADHTCLPGIDVDAVVARLAAEGLL